MNNTMKSLLLLAGIALLGACAAQPRPVDPNAQVPAPKHPAPIESKVTP